MTEKTAELLPYFSTKESLHQAVLNNDKDRLIQLLDNGANIDVIVTDKVTRESVSLAAVAVRINSPDILETLLDKGIQSDFSAVHGAVKERNLDAIAMLYAAYPDKDHSRYLGPNHIEKVFYPAIYENNAKKAALIFKEMITRQTALAKENSCVDQISSHPKGPVFFEALDQEQKELFFSAVKKMGLRSDLVNRLVEKEMLCFLDAARLAGV